jgi:hypothetical protein
VDLITGHESNILIRSLTTCVEPRGLIATLLSD